MSADMHWSIRYHFTVLLIDLKEIMQFSMHKVILMAREF